MNTKRLLLTVSTGLMTVLSASATVRSYIIDPDTGYQTIDGFGASDAWSMRFAGMMPDSIQSDVADLLFSRKSDTSGNPEGIGLSIWRFNIGAGSVEQGRQSQINNATRTECFLQPDGLYDWNKQKGQRNFLKLAKQHGVPILIGFLNSPPVYFTKNGLATNTGRDSTYNLREDKYHDFARFMADVIDGLKKHDGISLNYISPLNEPDGHWNWIGPKQEGTPASKYEIARIAKLLDNEITKRNLNTKIIIPESSDYRCMMSTHMTGADRGYEIQSFFSPDSTETYLGNLKNLPRLMAGHSYWTNTPVDTMKLTRIALHDTLCKYGVDFWQSEVCIMSNDEEIGGGHGFDRTMKTALYVARLIHHDLVYANARSWQWWRAIGGNYKDGLLFQYRDKLSGNDTIVDSKLLWALGNYSRFIRPGAERIDISASDSEDSIIPDSATDPYGLMLSAYRNADGSVIVVAINYSNIDEEVSIKAKGRNNIPACRKIYITSDNNDSNLSLTEELATDSGINIPARSIVTIVLH